jgi:hypothetical protein
LGAALQVQAGAARAGSDEYMSNCAVVVRITLLKNVDSAGARRVDPLSLCIKPEIVDAKCAR